jgi:hypothetical protein
MELDQNLSFSFPDPFYTPFYVAQDDDSEYGEMDDEEEDDANTNMMEPMKK